MILLKIILNLFSGLGACSAKADEFSCEDDTCIHKDLKCNEKYNCRTRFDEEDDDCQVSANNIDNFNINL